MFVEGQRTVERNSRVGGKSYVAGVEIQPWGSDLYTFHAAVAEALFKAGEEEVRNT